MSIADSSTNKQTEEEEPKVVDRQEAKVIDWRIHWLREAGWSVERSVYIAHLSVNDLLDLGYSKTAADAAYPDFWRLACSAMKCGDEALALYIIGLSSER